MSQGGSRALHASAARVGLSTASVYPESTAAAFELAGKLGYDGVEVMVWTDPISQDPHALRRLSDHYQVPILAIHAPCLIVTQRVWTTDPWIKLQKAQFAAELLGAQTVVVHPPFRWQRDYARRFRAGVDAMANETGVQFAVENMFPLRLRGREVSAYQPSWDVTAGALQRLHPRPVAHGGLAVRRAGDARRAWVIAWPICTSPTAPAPARTSTSSRGGVPSRVAEVLERVAGRGFGGHVVVEVNTRRAVDRRRA